jgi:hypothetical protein
LISSYIYVELNVTLVTSHIFVELNMPNVARYKGYTARGTDVELFMPQAKGSPPASVGRWADAISCIPFLKGENSRGKSACRLGNPLYEGEELIRHPLRFPV